MNIIHKSIYIINYETQQVILREPPATFDSYVAELINHISNNTSVREYKTHSDSTEVISCILKICANQTNENSVLDRMKILARRLLLEETKAQIQIRHTNTTVQKGSLIQALLLMTLQRSMYISLPKLSILNGLMIRILLSKPVFLRIKRLYGSHVCSIYQTSLLRNSMPRFILTPKHSTGATDFWNSRN